MREKLRLLVRFGLAGLANTAVGFSVIAALDVGLGVAPALANAAGYVVGVCVSFVLNRDFVFRSPEKRRTLAPRYLVAILIAFAANQAALHAASLMLGETPPERLLAQLCGMATYTVAQFLLFRFWVFREKPAA